MSHILAIETATEACSVAVVTNGKVVASKTEVASNIHAAQLTLFIEEVMQQAAITYADLHAVAVSKGPGSYTGLRIGVATAKGLCFALDIPLLAVNTLQALAYQFAGQNKDLVSKQNTLLCPMLDARRMEVYTAFYAPDLIEVKPTSADILDEQSYADYFASYNMVFFGNGAAKCKQLVSFAEKGIIIEYFTCNAEAVGVLAESNLAAGLVEDVAYFEPFYLKDFVVGVKKQ